MHCARTGEQNCKCLPQRKLPDVHPLKVDLKSVMRKLFTDHAVYTAFVLKSIVSGLDDTSVFVPRLLQNQKEIGNGLKPIIGEEKGNTLTKLLTEHINLAAEVIKAGTKKDPSFQVKENKLFENSDRVAAFLTSLNPAKLPYSSTQHMFHTHNEFVVQMAVARIKKDYKSEQQLYDAYYNEMLEMSDMIYNAL